jgi:hypothetical protein
MTDKKKERSTHDTAVASKEFLDTVADLMQRLEIGPGLAFSLFGLFARHVVEFEVEENGADRNEATIAALQAFTNGLGVKGAFIEMKGEAAAQLKAQVDMQNSDTPIQ